MTDTAFNTTENQAIGREMLLLYLNTGTKDAPVWSPLGKRVEESSMEYDWQEESKTDIFGETFNSMKKPIVKQSFDPWELANGDAAQKKIWESAIRDQDAQALCNMDVLIVHAYAGTANTAVFAERYGSSMIKNNSLGGTGGGNIGMPIDVTFGGTRTVGTAAVADGTVTFKSAAA